MDRVQVIVDDADRPDPESWTGYQIAWQMARGYPGQFGHKLNAPYVWLPLAAIFLLGLLDFRRPRRIAHLDLLVLLSFGISEIYFNAGEHRRQRPARLPAAALPAGADGLDRVPRPGARACGPSRADRLACGRRRLPARLPDRAQHRRLGRDRRRLRGRDRRRPPHPRRARSGATSPTTTSSATPTARSTTTPTSRSSSRCRGAAAGTTCRPPTRRRSSSTSRRSPASSCSARRLRPGADGDAASGVVLAFAWAAYPFTDYALQSNSNDTLVAALLVWALVALRRAGVAGAFCSRLATTTKFAPLALCPLFASRRAGLAERIEGCAGASRGCARWPSSRLPSSASVALMLALPAIDPGLATFYDRTIKSQIDRTSPVQHLGPGAEPSNGSRPCVKALAVGLRGRSSPSCRAAARCPRSPPWPPRSDRGRARPRTTGSTSTSPGSAGSRFRPSPSPPALRARRPSRPAPWPGPPAGASRRRRPASGSTRGPRRARR